MNVANVIIIINGVVRGKTMFANDVVEFKDDLLRLWRQPGRISTRKSMRREGSMAIVIVGRLRLISGVGNRDGGCGVGHGKVGVKSGMEVLGIDPSRVETNGAVPVGLGQYPVGAATTRA